MSTRETAWPDGAPCWVELVADDVDKARAFYSELFGWRAEVGPPEVGGYVRCTLEGRSVAGIVGRADPEQPTGWTTYLATGDLDATVGKVPGAGGQVLRPATDVGDLGRTALAVDPGGAVVGFWQTGAHTGFELADEPGSVTWSENFSRAWTQNQGFYAEVVGWEYDDMSAPGFQYATFRTAEGTAGGIGQLAADMPAEMPAHWNTYFKVEDTDDALVVVERLGGTVIRSAWDTPFGRMATVADDQGARCMLMAEVAGAG